MANDTDDATKPEREDARDLRIGLPHGRGRHPCGVFSDGRARASWVYPDVPRRFGRCKFLPDSARSGDAEWRHGDPSELE